MKKKKFWEFFFTKSIFIVHTHAFSQMHAHKVNKNTLFPTLCDGGQRKSEREIYKKKDEIIIIITSTRRDGLIMILLWFRIVVSLYFNTCNSVACSMYCVRNLDISLIYLNMSCVSLLLLLYCVQMTDWCVSVYVCVCVCCESITTMPVCVRPVCVLSFFSHHFILLYSS